MNPLLVTRQAADGGVANVEYSEPRRFKEPSRRRTQNTLERTHATR